MVWLWWKAFSLISSWDHCQRSSPSRISDTPGAGCDGFIGKFLLESQLNNHTINELFRSMLFLLHILNIFPLIVASFFENESQQSSSTWSVSVWLDHVLTIATELPKECYHDTIYERFVDELKLANPKSCIICSSFLSPGMFCFSLFQNFDFPHCQGVQGKKCSKMTNSDNHTLYLRNHRSGLGMTHGL